MHSIIIDRRVFEDFGSRSNSTPVSGKSSHCYGYFRTESFIHMGCLLTVFGKAIEFSHWQITNLQ